jgi:hypothetical protein
MTTAVLTWVDPTTLDDGVTPIPAGDFAYVQVSRSIDNGASYQILGHAAPGVQTYTDDVSALAPGAVLYEVAAVDTQTPPLTGPETAPVSVTIPTPALAPIAAPTALAVSLGA